MHLRKLWILAVLVITGLLNLYAQQDQLPQRKSISQTIVLKPVDSASSMNGFFLFGENIDNNLVKNAPYSAEAVNESINILADGNRIVKSTTTKLYRDSEGRMRREAAASALLSGAAISISTSFGQTAAPVLDLTSKTQFQISDPVAGVSFVLDPETRTAYKGTAYLADSQNSIVSTLIDRAKQELMSTGKPVAIGNAFVSVNITKGSAQPSAIEQLGTKIIEGVECVGTLTSSTIPAGQIGNERPIIITNERWYAPKLQADVLVKRSDPRGGENIYRLINIDQSEPSPELFEVPSGYTIVDMAEKVRENMKVIEIKRK